MTTHAILRLSASSFKKYVFCSLLLSVAWGTNHLLTLMQATGADVGTLQKVAEFQKDCLSRPIDEQVNGIVGEWTIIQTQQQIAEDFQKAIEMFKKMFVTQLKESGIGKVQLEKIIPTLEKRARMMAASKEEHCQGETETMLVMKNGVIRSVAGTIGFVELNGNEINGRMIDPTAFPAFTIIDTTASVSDKEIVWTDGDKWVRNDSEDDSEDDSDSSSDDQ